MVESIGGRRSEILFESHEIHQHLAWTGSLLRAYHSGGFELVHDSAGASETHRQTALKVGGRCSSGLHNHSCSLWKERIAVVEIAGFALRAFASGSHVFGQFVRLVIADLI